MSSAPHLRADEADAHDHRHSHGPGGHSHGGVDASLLESREAIRTLWRSLIILAVTAALQIVVVVASGSVALLSDTVHNLGDALTAAPLVAAFLLGRRAPTARLTYGWGRAEDLAGLAVLAIILFSAVYAGYEAIARLIHPTTPGYLLAVGLAGAIGFAGNEWVAVYRLRTGRRIGSAALVADGYHARIDGFTSLAVVAGAIGVALGFRLADPIVGLAIAVVILRIVWTSAKEIGLRVLDGIEPEIIETIRQRPGRSRGAGRGRGARPLVRARDPRRRARGGQRGRHPGAGPPDRARGERSAARAGGPPGRGRGAGRARLDAPVRRHLRVFRPGPAAPMRTRGARAPAGWQRRWELPAEPEIAVLEPHQPQEQQNRNPLLSRSDSRDPA